MLPAVVTVNVNFADRAAANIIKVSSSIRLHFLIYTTIIIIAWLHL